MSLPPNPLKGELPNNEVQMDFDMENTPFRGQGVDLVLHYDQLMNEYYECPVGAVDKLAEIENVRLLTEKTKMKSIDLPISKHVKQLIIQLYGNEPINILDIVSEPKLRRFKFEVERPEPRPEDYKKTTISLLVPLQVRDIFSSSRYYYQIEAYLNKIFDEKLIDHLTAQTRAGVKINPSIIDFFQRYDIDETSIPVETLRKRWQRERKREKV